jgi:hypothetical protein
LLRRQALALLDCAMRLAPTALLIGFALQTPLTASPINVSYTTTGSPGDWTLNFSVNNNLIGFPGQFLFLFGVLLSSNDSVGSAPYFFAYGSFDPVGLGGPDINYNNVWLGNGPEISYLPGTTASGFEAVDSDAVAPSSNEWYVFTTCDISGFCFLDSPYTGSGSFYNDPSHYGTGFDGVAMPTNAAPEPSTFALIAVGVAGAALLRAHRRGRISSLHVSAHHHNHASHKAQSHSVV